MKSVCGTGLARQVVCEVCVWCGFEQETRGPPELNPGLLKFFCTLPNLDHSAQLLPAAVPLLPPDPPLLSLLLFSLHSREAERAAR